MSFSVSREKVSRTSRSLAYLRMDDDLDEVVLDAAVSDIEFILVGDLLEFATTEELENLAFSGHERDSMATFKSSDSGGFRLSVGM